MSGRPVVVLEALSLRARPTGVAGAILELVGALAAHDRGLSFVVAAAGADPFNMLAGVPNWRVVVCPDAGHALRRAWFIQRGLPALCREVGAELLHCLQLVAPVRPTCPVAVTVHDLAWRELPWVVQRPRRTYYDALVPEGLRRARRILASSAATAHHVASHYPELADRVRVTPLGTPTWVYESGGSAADPAPDRPFFLFVGALEPRKNLPRLLEAYEMLVAERGDRAPDLRLMGPDGWSMEPLRRRLASPALHGRVTLGGYCGRAELRQLYGSALALVFPSLLEGFGLPVLEAMACGLPVMTSDSGALAEVAGDAALLVDPWDAGALAAGLGRLADDAALRGRLRQAGPLQASRWTWARTAARTTEVYAEILTPDGGRK